MQGPRRERLETQALHSYSTPDAAPERAAPKKRRKARRGPNALGRRRQHLGYLAGLILGLGLVFVLLLPGQEQLHALGPMNTGHENLTCQSCHQEAEGTLRQQIQANVQHALGLRENNVSFGHEDVDNATCISCHERANDSHPVSRFFEPRFKEARATLAPETCTTCHNEHEGQRVTLPDLTYCQTCHQDTSIENDPITVSHEELIAANDWETCLGCHDYHGNHIMETETVVYKALPAHEIQAYFEGGPSPYSDERYYQAKQEITNE